MKQVTWRKFGMLFFEQRSRLVSNFEASDVVRAERRRWPSLDGCGFLNSKTKQVTWIK